MEGGHGLSLTWPEKIQEFYGVVPAMGLSFYKQRGEKGVNVFLTQRKGLEGTEPAHNHLSGVFYVEGPKQSLGTGRRLAIRVPCQGPQRHLQEEEPALISC